MRSVPAPGERSREDRYRALFAAVHDPLRRFVARRAEAAVVDDVVADTLLVAWRRLDDVPTDAELAWCYGVARRCLANQRRSESRRLGLVERIATERATPAAYDDPHDAAGHDDALHIALAQLTADDRAVIELWAWEDLAPREIATVLGISANAASIRLHRAKRRLKSALETGKAGGGAGHPAGERDREPR